MTRTRPFEAEHADASWQCDDCHSLALFEEPYCGACGGHLTPRKESRVAYDAVAIFIGVVVAILYFIGRS
jgi:hypothetical protein